MKESTTRVLGVTGMPGSGKSEFALFAGELGYHTVVMGDVVRAKVMGDAAIAHLTCIAIDKLIAKGKRKLIIDGIRSQAEVLHFKEHMKNSFVIIAIHVDPELRFKRLKVRGRKDAPITEEDFNKRDRSELELGLGETIAFSNYIIPNNKSMKDFKEKALSLLNELERGNI